MHFESPFRWTDPHTWPWFVFVWLAITAAGFAKPLWRRLKRQRAQSWSSVSGRIESVRAFQPKALFFFAPSKDSSVTHVAEIDYSYSTAGKTLSGSYKRDFPTEWEALDFLRDLEGKPVTVLVDPSNSSSSTLSEPAVETLLQTRPQISEGELAAARSANSIPPRLIPFLPVFLALSGIGFLLSLWVNVGSLMGRQVLPGAFFVILHIGLFVVWFPAVFVAKQKVGNLQRKDLWKVLLRGAPDWLRYLVYAIFIYSVAESFASMAHSPPAGGPLDDSSWRQFSGVWMAFYSGAFAILYAASIEGYGVVRCLKGHPVLPGASFCTQCGQPVRRSS